MNPRAKDRIKIREALIARGVPPAEVIPKLCAEIFPWHVRMLEAVRVFFGGDPSTAELKFVQEFADCSSGTEIEEAFLDYHQATHRGALARVIGLTPRLSRVLDFYRRLKAQRSGDRSGSPAL